MWDNFVILPKDNILIGEVEGWSTDLLTLYPNQIKNREKKKKTFLKKIFKH